MQVASDNPRRMKEEKRNPVTAAVLLEQNDEWAVPCARYMPRDTMVDLLTESSTNELSVMANWST